MPAARRKAAAAAEGMRATRFDVAVLGLLPLLAFATTSNSFSMETVFPLTVVLAWRHVVRSYQFGTRIGSRWTSLCLFGFVWLGFSLLVNLFVHPDDVDAISLVRWLYVGSALAFFCVVTAPRFTLDDVAAALRLSVVSGVVIALAIIANFLRGATGKVSFVTPLGGAQETNFTGSLLALILLLGLVRLRITRAGLRLDVVMLVPVAAALLLTGSRAAALGAGVGVVLFFVLSYRFTTSSTLRLGAGVAGLGVVVWLLFRNLPVWTVDRILVNSYADDSNLRRLQLWRNALRGFLQMPLTGHGVGNFVANPDETMYGIDPVTSHSTYLSMLVDGGVVYFVVIAVVVGSACLAMVRPRREFLGYAACFAIVTMIVDASRMAFFWYGLVMMTVVGSAVGRDDDAGPPVEPALDARTLSRAAAHGPALAARP